MATVTLVPVEDNVTLVPVEDNETGSVMAAAPMLVNQALGGVAEVADYYIKDIPGVGGAISRNVTAPAKGMFRENTEYWEKQATPGAGALVKAVGMAPAAGLSQAYTGVVGGGSRLVGDMSETARQSVNMELEAAGVAVPEISSNEGTNPALRFSKQVAEEGKLVAKEMESEVASDSGYGWAGAVRGGLGSAYNNLMTLPLAIINPTMALGSMGVMSGGQGYADARDKDFSIGSSLVQGTGKGVVEVATERIPFGKLMELLKPAAKQSFGQMLKLVGKMQLGEYAGESLNTIYTDVQDKLVENPNATMSQRIDNINNYFTSGEAENNLIDTLKTTLVQTTAMGGGAAVINRNIQPSSSSVTLTPAEDTPASSLPRSNASPVFQEEGFDDTEDMSAPGGPLAGAVAMAQTANAAGTASAPVDTDNIPDFAPMVAQNNEQNTGDINGQAKTAIPGAGTGNAAAIVEAAQTVPQSGSENQLQGVDGPVGNGMPVVQPSDVIHQAAHQAATSPLNDTPEPTQKQIEAGNYKKGHVNLHGLDISVENPAGSLRKGVDPDGKAWSTELAHHYGYIKGTVGKDKDHIDVFIGRAPESSRVFVVDQIDPKTGRFDEHKVMLGFGSSAAAREGYLANYDKSGPDRIGSLTETTVDEFKQWLKDGNTKKVFAETAELSQARKWVVEQIQSGKGWLMQRKGDSAEQYDQRILQEYRKSQEVVTKTVKQAVPSVKRNLDTSKDSMLVAMARLGGVDRAELGAQMGNEKELAGTLNKLAGKEARSFLHVVHTKGLPLDKMRESLAELGYLDQDSSINDMLDKIDSAMRGKPQYSTQADSQLLADKAYDEELERHKADLADIYSNLSDEDLDAISYKEFSDDEQRVFDILYAEAAEKLQQAVVDFETRNDRLSDQDWLNYLTGAEASMWKEIEDGVITKSPGAAEQTESGKPAESVVGSESDTGEQAAEGSGKADEKPAAEVASSSGEQQEKLFANPSKFGTKPQPKTTKGDVSTSDLLDGFTATETVQPSLDENNEFIKTTNGNIDFGSITPEIGRAIRRESAPLRLRIGNDSEGLRHIEKRHSADIKALGYTDAVQFVQEITSDFSAVYQADAGALDLVVTDGKLKFARVKLELSDDGTYYDIKTATPGRNDQYKNKKPLWENAGPSVSSGDNQTPLIPGANAALHNSSIPLTAEKVKTKSADKTKVTDAGEELTYNKRNRIKSGIKWTDVQDKNEALKAKEIQKPTVYPKPDYEAMVADGMQPMVAHMVKQVYDAIPVKPVTGRSLATDADFKNYIEAVNRVMEGAIAWANDKDAILAWADKNAKVAGAMAGRQTSIISMLPDKNGKLLVDFVYPGGWSEYKDEVYILGGRSMLSSLQQPGYEEVRRAIKDVDKGWPGKIEAWQRQGIKVIPADIFKVEEHSYREGSVFFVVGKVGSIRTLEAGQFDSRDAAQSFLDNLKPFAIFNKRNRLVDTYETEEAAKEAARNSIKKEGKEAVNERGMNVAEAERIGPAYREEGENITSEKLMDTFGFRGVNFGNWVPNDERQMHLNHAYDSFFDLAAMLNLPPKAISLNGMLGLAIGAQGSGAWAAHFVPGVNEINITRTAGAGSVAHEWAHSMDHYFATQAGYGAAAAPYMTVLQRNNNKWEVRPEIIKAFSNIVQVMQKRQETPEQTAAREASMLKSSKDKLESWLKYFGKQFEGNEQAASEFSVIADKIRNNDYKTGEGAYVQITPARGKWDLGTVFLSIVADVRDLSKKYKIKIPMDNFKALNSNVSFVAHMLDKQDDGHKPQMTMTTFKKNALKLDEGKKNAYWAAPQEMFARAFDAFIVDRLLAQDQSNTYLAHLNRDGDTVPMGEEREIIVKAFDELIGEIKTRETDKGIAMFSRNTKNVSVPFSDVEFETIFKRVTARSKNPDAFVVAHTAAELPQAILAEAKKQGTKPNEIDGVFHRGKVYIVRDQITSAEHLEDTIFHEWHGHAGIKGMFGRDTFNAMVELYETVTPGKLYPIGRKYGINLMKYGHSLAKAGYDLETRKAIMAEEMLAFLTAEYSRGNIATKIREVIGQIRAWLRDNGFANLAQWGETDIAWLLKKARIYAEAGVGQSASGTVFSTGQDMLDRLRESGITDDMLENLLAAAPKFAAAWHGSPHSFDKFTTEAIGTGEGAQAYGYGLYFAGSKDVAEWYKERLSDGVFKLDGEVINVNHARNVVRDAILEVNPRWTRDVAWDVAHDVVEHVIDGNSLDELRQYINQYDNPADYTQTKIRAYNAAIDVAQKIEYEPPKGRLYQVELAPAEDEYLLWDKSLSEQSEKVQDALESAGYWDSSPEITGSVLYRELSHQMSTPGKDDGWNSVATTINDRTSNDRKSSEHLHSLGIRGIKYLDGSSRNSGYKVSRIWENENKPNAPQWRVSSQNGYNEIFKIEGDAIRDAEERNANNLNYNYVIFNDADVEIQAKFSLARQDKTGIIDDRTTKIQEGLYVPERLRERYDEEVSKGAIGEAASICRGIHETVRRGEITGNSAWEKHQRYKELADTSLRPAETEALREWALSNNLILEHAEFDRLWKEQGSKHGAEHNVHLTSDGERIIKRNDLSFHETYLDYFNRLAVHNTEFPETAYSLDGFFDIGGKLMPVVSQSAVRGRKATFEESHNNMIKRGFEPVEATSKPINYRIPDTGLFVRDVHGDNTRVTDSGSIYVVDPVIEFDLETKQDRLAAEAGVDSLPKQSQGDKVEFGDEVDKALDEWDSQTRFALKGVVEKISEKSILNNLKNLLNPLDYSRFKNKAVEHLPNNVSMWLADNIGNPFWVKENNPAAVPFYEEAKQREVTRLDNNIRMFGGLVDKDGNKTKMEKLKSLFEWGDKTTAWGRLRQQQYDTLTDKQKAAYDVIRFEGDAYNKVYATLSNALRNPRIKAAGLDAATFQFYQDALGAEAVAFDEKLKIAAENMAEAGVSKEEIEGHIAEFRARYADIEGWVHRDHGEGDHQVRVYHTIDRLDFLVDEVTHQDAPADRIRLGYFPGADLSYRLQKIAEDLGGSVKQLRNGALVLLLAKGQGSVALERFNRLPLVDSDGKPKYKVLVYSRYALNEAAAKKLARQVEGDLAAAMPRNYRNGHTYETSWRFAEKMYEEDFQALRASDMKLETVLSQAITKAKAKGEITEDEGEEVRQALVQNIAETLLGRGAGLYQIRRAQYLIEGYDTDNAVKKYEDYVNGVAGMFSKARYALHQFHNMQKAGARIRQWAFKYVADSLRNMGRADQISGNVRSIVSLWYLGFNASWMLVNSTQPYVLGQAELSRHTKSPALKIGKAEKDIIKDNLTAAEKALFEDERTMEQDRESVMAEMTGSLEGVGGKLSKALHTATRFSLAMGQKVEVLNRHTMILAAYRIFRHEKGLNHEAAYKKAMDVNSMVNIDMGRYNLPGWARGSLGRTFYALQSYIQHTLNYLWNRSSSGSRADQKAVLRLLWAMFLIGGLPAGAPGSDELDKLILKWFGYSPKLAFKGWARKHAKEYGTAGEMLEGFVWRGVPGALKPFGVGVSFTGSTQLRMPVISNIIAGDDMAKTLTGPVGGLVQKGVMAGRQAGRGDYDRVIEYLLPTAAANVMSAVRQSTEGVRTSHGKVVEYKGKPLKLQPQEAAIRALGMQPARTADISETRGAEKSIQAEWNERRRDALDNYRNSRKLKFISDFNQELKGSQAIGLVPAITPESLKQVWGKPDKKKTAWEKRYGVD
jgi:hypothetical protein